MREKANARNHPAPSRGVIAGPSIKSVSRSSWGDVTDYTSLSPSAAAGSYTCEEIEDAIRMNNSAPRWRLFLLNADGTKKKEIPPEDIAFGGSYSENYQNGQRRSLNITLYNENGKYTPGVNGIWITSRIGLEMGFEMLDGGMVWFKRGEYVVGQPSIMHSNDQDIVQVSAGDKWTLFTGALGSLENTYEIPVGSTISEVIRDIQLIDKDSGEPLDPREPSIYPSLRDKKTQSTITMNAGQTYADILLELATQASAEIFYDADGTLTLIPLSEASSDDGKAPQWEFGEEQVRSIGFSFSAQEIYNRVIVIGSTSNGRYYRAEASNEDPSSPTSTRRVGVRTAPIINDANITTEYQAEERAQYELRKVLLLKTPLTIETPIVPFVSANCAITVSSPKLKMSHERFIVQSVSLPLDYSGTMTINATSMRNLPFLTEADEAEVIEHAIKGDKTSDIIRVDEETIVSDRAIVGSLYIYSRPPR